MKRTRLIIIAIVFMLFSYGIYSSRFSFHGKPQGIYLLKGAGRELFELKDHLQLVEYERLIAKIEFEAFYERWRSKDKAADGTPYLKYSWGKKTGSGYLISFFPDGSRFLACLGRFPDADSNPVKGLFVGGGLPSAHYENAALKTPETGVAYYDASGWHHLWGSTDEALSAADAAQGPIRPGRWEFIGSEILFSSQYQLALKSSHLVRLGQQQLRVDRYFNYHAGDRFFSLVNRLTNPGSLPLVYHYSYEDGPWRPHAGTPDSKGRQDSTTHIDLINNYYIGLSGYRYSPDLERAAAGSIANFLSWQGGALPSSGYLTRKPVTTLSAKGKAPLKDCMSREIMLRWQARTLMPGQSETIMLTIGMADNDRQTNTPRCPAVAIDPAELRFLLSR
jgi:hypothetical protein